MVSMSDNAMDESDIRKGMRCVLQRQRKQRETWWCLGVFLLLNVDLVMVLFLECQNSRDRFG